MKDCHCQCEIQDTGLGQLVVRPSLAHTYVLFYMFLILFLRDRLTIKGSIGMYKFHSPELSKRNGIMKRPGCLCVKYSYNMNIWEAS